MTGLSIRSAHEKWSKKQGGFMKLNVMFVCHMPRFHCNLSSGECLHSLVIKSVPRVDFEISTEQGCHRSGNGQGKKFFKVRENQ